MGIIDFVKDAGRKLGLGDDEPEESGLSDAAEAEAAFYTIVQGDTLWKIAEAHYGDGSRYTEIFTANRPMLEDPDRIYPDQVLRIPGA